MITVNSLSGGKTSSYMAIHHPTDINIFACVCIDDKASTPKDKAILDYAFDKLNGDFIATAEHDKTLKVMMDLEQLLGKSIVWVRGKSFDKVIEKNKALPSAIRRFCTVEMKIQPIFEYLYPRFGKVAMNIGFRGDEYERIIRSTETQEQYKAHVSTSIETKRKKWEVVEWREKFFPLRSTYHFEIIKYWKDKGLDFPNDSNCVGCHHKSEMQINKNWKESPEKMEWFAKQEEKTTGKKAHTWKDSLNTYRMIKGFNYTSEISFENYTMCNSGYCTD